MKEYEKKVADCYATWSKTYYEDYYGDKASYPPVQRDIIRELLLQSGARNVLDAGCGPASFLRHLVHDGIALYGFDLSPEMVDEARNLLAREGVPPDRVWQGSVIDAASFRAPGPTTPLFDAVVCVGVIPHIPKEKDGTLLRNLYNAVKPGGMAILEARNQFFALFSLNRYSYQFFEEELVRRTELEGNVGDRKQVVVLALEELKKRFRMDLPPIRTGSGDRPGYDEVLSRTHNPLLLKQQFEDAGFVQVRPLFYHYHVLPPMFEPMLPEVFRAKSLAMEDPNDWRGHFMASAFILVGAHP